MMNIVLKTNNLLVVECPPQKRTIFLKFHGSTYNFFLKFPYLFFYITHDHLTFINLRIYTSDSNFLLSQGCLHPLILPNIHGAYVCMGYQMITCENEADLIDKVVGSFWQTKFKTGVDRWFTVLKNNKVSSTFISRPC